jgi:hypothetical protein
MKRSTEWLITSRECVAAKRATNPPPGEPAPKPEREAERRPHPAPGFGGDRRLPEEEPGREQEPGEPEQTEQPVGFPE